MTTTERLAAGQTPFLLEPENRPMSRGPWYIYDAQYGLITNENKECIASVSKQANAAFIASLNGAEPIVEELWEDYQTYSEIAKDYKGVLDDIVIFDLEKRALRKLRRLDGLKCLGWRGKE